jgi:MYXO-CTERM domain-containing protein
MGEVTPTGTAQPFIPKEGFEKTPEEEIKTRPSGCGCAIPGTHSDSPLFWLAPLGAVLAIALRFGRRRPRA